MKKKKPRRKTRTPSKQPYEKIDLEDLSIVSEDASDLFSEPSTESEDEKQD